MYTFSRAVCPITSDVFMPASSAFQLLSRVRMKKMKEVKEVNEQTIAAPIEFSGIGLHTGEPATMRILPAPAGKGIVFRRIDLDNFELRADVGSVERVAYATTLMKRGVWISTVEHLLSALYGFGIDNAFVELDNFEVPILDGSGLLYIEAIHRAGIVMLEAERSVMCITK